MKKILVIFTTFVLAFTMLSPMALAEELDTPQPIVTEQSQPTDIEKPQEPVITGDMTENEANQLIDNYNNQVDEYNNQIEQINASLGAEHAAKVEEIDKHNTEEQLKVQENEKQLEKQEVKDNKIAADIESKLAEQTTNSNGIPTSWEETNATPQTIQVVKNNIQSDETYKIANLHIYLDENADSTYYGTGITNTNFYVDNSIKNHLILCEWETVGANKNDTVKVYSQASLYPSSGALFRRQLSGYTNGYWIPTQEFTSTAKYVGDNWDTNGPFTEFSYIDGTTDRLSLKDVLNIFTYSFIRYGAEPERVEKYEPDFWEYPSSDIKYYDYLTKLDRIKREFNEGEIGDAPSVEESEPPIEEPNTIIEENDRQEILPAVTTPTVAATPALPITPTFAMAPVITPLVGNDNLVPTTAATPASNNTEEGNQVVEIQDNETPLAHPNARKAEKKESWALINLILMIINLIACVKIPKKDREEDEDKEVNRRNNIVPILFAIGAVLAFIFTENVRLPMVLVDKWTLSMIILSIGGVGTSFIFKDKIVNKEKEEEA